jgi:hypothetical protein
MSRNRCRPRIQSPLAGFPGSVQRNDLRASPWRACSVRRCGMFRRRLKPPMCFSATCHRSAWRAESAAPPGPVTRSGPDSPHISLVRRRRAGWARGCRALGTTCCPALQMLWTTWDQLLFHLSCAIAHAGDPANRATGDGRFNPKLPDHELRLLGACGKERTGFPQAGAAQPPEIQHPIDPETRKRCYIFIAASDVTISGTDECYLYCVDTRTLNRLLPGGECSKALWTSQGT